jgi:ATP-dependent Clp protease ATP-binding subunit ClpX
MTAKTASPTTLRCSFCGKDADGVKYLLAGPDVHICGECIVTAQAIIDREGQAEASQ